MKKINVHFTTSMPAYRTISVSKDNELALGVRCSNSGECYLFDIRDDDQNHANDVSVFFGIPVFPAFEGTVSDLMKLLDNEKLIKCIERCIETNIAGGSIIENGTGDDLNKTLQDIMAATVWKGFPEYKFIAIDDVRKALTDMLFGGMKVLLISPRLDGLSELSWLYTTASDYGLVEEIEIKTKNNGVLLCRREGNTRGLCNFDALIVMPGCTRGNEFLAISTLRGEMVVDPVVVKVR